MGRYDTPEQRARESERVLLQNRSTPHAFVPASDLPELCYGCRQGRDAAIHAEWRRT